MSLEGLEDTENRVYLTTEQAIRLLPAGKKEIHTFANPSAGFMLGADLSRERVEKMIDQAEIREISGPTAAGMGHGLCIWLDKRPLFIETEKDRGEK